ncbi:MAG: radical SAM protein [Candidatus Woesearchaeota archaeon]
MLEPFLGYSRVPAVTASTEVKTMILHSTWKCNLNCKYCYLDIDGVEKKDMSLDTILSAVEQFSKEGGLFLDISGGEPLLRKDLPIIVKKGYDEALRVTIVTNGTLLNAEKINSVREHIHQISISIDGFGRAHDDLRGEGTFEKMSAVLDLLRSYQIPAGVTTVVNKSSAAQLPELYRFLSSFGVKQWNLTLLRATGRARKTGIAGGQVFLDDFLKTTSEEKNMEIVVDESLLGPEMRTVLKEIYDWHAYARWHNTLTVLPNGDCVACVFFPQIVYGNITQDSIYSIYNSPVRKEVLSLKKPCDRCPIAGNE